MGAEPHSAPSPSGSTIVGLAQRAYEILGVGLDDIPETDDPVADLIDVGVNIFRLFVRDHPSLYRIAFQRIVPNLQAGQELTEAREQVFPRLVAKVKRLEDAGLLDGRSAREAAVEFNAMCEGLANAELPGSTLPILPAGRDERAWRVALASLIRGFGETE